MRTSLVSIIIASAILELAGTFQQGHAEVCRHKLQAKTGMVNPRFDQRILVQNATNDIQVFSDTDGFLVRSASDTQVVLLRQDSIWQKNPATRILSIRVSSNTGGHTTSG